MARRRPWTVTRAEALELKRRDEHVRRHGGVSIEQVRADMLADMDRELRKMVAGYDGSPARAKALLEALVIAEEEGVESCAEIRRLLARKTKRSRAA
jgi:hypothetical protein